MLEKKNAGTWRRCEKGLLRRHLGSDWMAILFFRLKFEAKGADYVNSVFISLHKKTVPSFEIVFNLTHCLTCHMHFRFLWLLIISRPCGQVSVNAHSMLNNMIGSPFQVTLLIQLVDNKKNYNNNKACFDRRSQINKQVFFCLVFVSLRIQTIFYNYWFKNFGYW